MSFCNVTKIEAELEEPEKDDEKIKLDVQGYRRLQLPNDPHLAEIMVQALRDGELQDLWSGSWDPKLAGLKYATHTMLRQAVGQVIGFVDKVPPLIARMFTISKPLWGFFGSVPNIAFLITWKKCKITPPPMEAPMPKVPVIARTIGGCCAV